MEAITCPHCYHLNLHDATICARCKKNLTASPLPEYTTAQSAEDHEVIPSAPEASMEDKSTDDKLNTPMEEEPITLLLKQVVYTQQQQEQILKDVQQKVGCLFAYMVVSLIIGGIGILLTVVF